MKHEVITVAYTGPKFKEALYEKTEGILVNGGVVSNFRSADPEYLQARVEALLRHSNGLQEYSDHLQRRVDELIKENNLLKGFVK